MQTKTLIFCCNSLWGLVNFRGRVIEALVRDGHRVVLVARRDLPIERANALGAEFLNWNISPRGTSIREELAAIAELHRIYRLVQPDLIFNFTIKPVIYGAVVARWCGISSIAVITGLGYMFLSSRWKAKAGKFLYRVTLRRSREVWFLNTDDKQIFDLAGLINGLPVKMLPGEGVDLARFTECELPARGRTFIFLMISRLVKDKGVLEYIEAAAKVKQRYPFARFQLLGPEYSANAMSVPLEHITRSVSNGTIEYLGNSDDVRPAIAASHCVVLPSYREGMPRVLMEAAAMGRPAIATDVVGCRDIVIPNVTGFLCAARDVDALAQRCIEMVEMPASSFETMGREARQHAVDRFDDNIIISLYKASLNTPTSSSRYTSA